MPTSLSLRIALVVMLAAVLPAAGAPPPPGTLAYPLVFPIAGETRFSDSFGDGRAGHSHLGCDVLAPKLTPVLAIGSGIVDWIQDGSRGRCCGLGIQHDDGYRSRYMHLNNDTFGTDDGQVVGIAPGLVFGSRVEAGQLIGWVGDSGNAEDTAPHLHLELIGSDGEHVDPFPSLCAVRPGEAMPASRVAPRPVTARTVTARTATARRGERASRHRAGAPAALASARRHRG